MVYLETSVRRTARGYAHDSWQRVTSVFCVFAASSERDIEFEILFSEKEPFSFHLYVYRLIGLLVE